MVIDSHQHFWKVGAFDYPWMSPTLVGLYRDFMPGDLEPLLRASGVDRTILVQASPTAAETDFLLALASGHDFIAGVVGWLDLEADDFSAQLETRLAHERFVGFRPAVEFIQDDRWLAQPRVSKNLAIAEKADVPFDLITWPRHLPAVLEMLAVTPGVRCVVDHLSKPDILNGKMEPWRSLVAEVALHNNVFCKLSGMHAQADHEKGTNADLQPYVEHVLACFGPRRVMFGSDWPVCIRGGNYARTIESLKEILGPQTLQSHKADIFGGNAHRFYRLHKTAPTGAHPAR